MMFVLGDDIWSNVFSGFISNLPTGLIVFALGLVVFYLWQRDRKELSYEIVTNTVLLSMSEELEGKVKIVFNDEPKNDVSLVKIKITNTGNKAIFQEDFKEEVSFVFSNTVEILSVTYVDPFPQKFSLPSSSLQKSKVLLEPVFLNKKNGFTIKVLASGNIIWVDQAGRIGDVTIQKYVKFGRTNIIIYVGLFVGLINSSIGSTIDQITKFTPTGFWAVVDNITFILANVSILLVVAGLLYKRISKFLQRFK